MKNVCPIESGYSIISPGEVAKKVGVKKESIVALYWKGTSPLRSTVTFESKSRGTQSLDASDCEGALAFSLESVLEFLEWHEKHGFHPANLTERRISELYNEYKTGLGLSEIAQKNYRRLGFRTYRNLLFVMRGLFKERGYVIRSSSEQQIISKKRRGTIILSDEIANELYEEYLSGKSIYQLGKERWEELGYSCSRVCEGQIGRKFKQKGFKLR